MKYLYETHCHTACVSACGKNTPEDIVAMYAKNGYAGVIVTDHFLNGNCLPEIRQLPTFADRIHRYFSGYEQVKACAGERLTVFGGIETSYGGTDVLVYGWDEQTTASYPEIMDLSMRDFIRFANEHGALTVQAHPFREAGYIDHIRLYPETQGVEVLNSSRDELCNELGYKYWEAYNARTPKVKIGGSDCHYPYQPILSGVAFDTPLSSIEDFIERLRRGEGEIFTKENEYKPQE